MRKLILQCSYAAGDIVMLTAAVRDLHLTYPGEFITDVRTPCPEIWENNPFVTPLREGAAGVELVKCEYPLIDDSNELPYHCLHGYRKFLNQQLGLSIRPAAFKGDIHISEKEKGWYSQVYEQVGADIPFWIVAAGGKHDVTIKWWSHERYQRVVDHFRERILFVQVGEIGHHHPKLNGALDLRGQTNFRELIRLVYHAQGVLCPVTALMHLAAAVETKSGAPRPCVVVAGAREPAHWEAYPAHQFISTNGAVKCSGPGGCWKDRVKPLGDGSERDEAQNLCEDVRNNLPRCMDLITPLEVCTRINFYFSGGAVHYLTGVEYDLKEECLARQRPNDYDLAPLSKENAGVEFRKFLESESKLKRRFYGKGFVICAGGEKYLTCAWVCVRMLREHGCDLPIEIWHMENEITDAQKRIFDGCNVRFVDASELRKIYPTRWLDGWELKPYAILHSGFEEVIFIDADNVAVKNPEFLFESADYQAHGALFWPDYERGEKTGQLFRILNVERPEGPEFESGQIVVNKRRCLRALEATVWLNENSDFFYQYLHGDKETFHIAWEATNTPYYLIPHPILPLEGTMCQHAPDGQRLFQHRNMLKWSLGENKIVEGFLFEEQCFELLEELRKYWTNCSSFSNNNGHSLTE